MSSAVKGRDLKDLIDRLDLRNEEVCVEARVSMSSLRNVLNDAPGVRPRTKNRVLEAFERLKSRKAAG